MTSDTKMTITDITANPFDDWELFETQEEQKRLQIQSLLTSNIAIEFSVHKQELLFHPSAKVAGAWQLTVMESGLPISDSQHGNIESATSRLCDYEGLKVVKVA